MVQPYYIQPYYTTQSQDVVELMRELMAESKEKLDKNRKVSFAPIYIELTKYIVLQGMLSDEDKTTQKGYAKEALIDDMQDSYYVTLPVLHQKSITANHKETNARENIRAGASKILSEGFRKLGHLFKIVDNKGNIVPYKSKKATYIEFHATRQSIKDREESKITFDMAKRTILNLVLDDKWVSAKEVVRKFKDILGVSEECRTLFSFSLYKLINGGYMEKDVVQETWSRRGDNSMNYRLRRTSKPIKLRKPGRPKKSESP